MSDQPSPFANAQGGRNDSHALANLASVFGGGSSTDLSKLQNMGSFPSIPHVRPTPLCSPSKLDTLPCLLGQMAQ